MDEQHGALCSSVVAAFRRRAHLRLVRHELNDELIGVPFRHELNGELIGYKTGEPVTRYLEVCSHEVPPVISSVILPSR